MHINVRNLASTFAYITFVIIICLVIYGNIAVREERISLGNEVDKIHKEQIKNALQTRKLITNYMLSKSFLPMKEMELYYDAALEELGNRFLIGLAIAEVESSFNRSARSKTPDGKVIASGLCGVRYSIWGEILKEKKLLTSERDLYSPAVSFRAMKFILFEQNGKSKDGGYLEEQKFSLTKALTAYNVGPSNVSKAKSTYSEKVYNALGRIYGVMSQPEKIKEVVIKINDLKPIPN